jgi:hypothetical protein
MLPDFEANVRSKINQQMLDVRLGAVESMGWFERCIDRGFWQAKFGGEKIFGGEKKEKKKLWISTTIPETAVKSLMLQANGIYAKILTKLNFTCEECIFRLQKYFYKFW